MASPSLPPLYTPSNTVAVYRLFWGFDLFWKTAPHDASWQSALAEALRKHHIRLLRHQFLTPTTSQFLMSTRPAHAPQWIAKNLKGLLQHIVQAHYSIAFQRNYGFRSLGSTKRSKAERYVASQLGHHRLADPRFEAALAPFQMTDSAVDLAVPRRTAHSVYWYNLHLRVVNDGRWREHDSARFATLREWIVRVARSRDLTLSRAGILPDHIHLTFGVGSERSPEEVALCFMNNLAYGWGMKPVFQSGYFVGTFGEYDLGSVRGTANIAPPA